MSLCLSDQSDFSNKSLTSGPLLIHTVSAMGAVLHSDLLTPVVAGESSSLSVLVPEAPEASGSGGQQATSHTLPAEATPDAPPQKLLHPHRRVTSLDQVRGLTRLSSGSTHHHSFTHKQGLPGH